MHRSPDDPSVCGYAGSHYIPLPGMCAFLRNLRPGYPRICRVRALTGGVLHERKNSLPSGREPHHSDAPCRLTTCHRSALRQSWQVWRSEGWRGESQRLWDCAVGRQAPAKLNFGIVIEQHSRGSNYYLAQMAYSYAVNGECYSGDYEKMFLREGSAQKFADEGKGRPAVIRHKASAPEVSALLPEDQQSVWPLRDKG